MIATHKRKVLIPQWAVCAIEYGDYYGLSKEDRRAVEEWLEDLKEDGFSRPVFNWCGLYGFTNYPEFGEAADCDICEVLQLMDEKKIRARLTTEMAREIFDAAVGIADYRNWSLEHTIYKRFYNYDRAESTEILNAIEG